MQRREFAACIALAFTGGVTAQDTYDALVDEFVAAQGAHLLPWSSQPVA